MMKISELFQGARARMNRAQWQVATGVLLSVPGIAQAALPTQVAPTTTPASGNWILLVEGYVKDGGKTLALALSLASLVWIAWIGIAKFNEVRNGKAEMGDLGLTVGIGAVLLMFIGYLLTEAGTVI